MESKHIVAGLGEILWDLLPDGKQLGGAPANFAYHCMRLGAEAYPVSAVGKDILGEEILQRLNAVGLDRQYVVTDPLHPTGTVSVTIEEGQPQYIIHTDVAWDNIPLREDSLHLARRLDAVCFGTLAQRAPVSRDTIQKFVQETRPECLRVLDINLRQEFYDPEIIDASLSLANIMKLNENELAVVADLLDFDSNGNHLLEQIALKYNLHMIALTRGSDGSRLYTVEAVSDHPGYETELIDTIGAGDAFTAAMVMGFLRDHTIDVINEEANQIASFVCSRKGAMPEYEYDVLRRTIK